MTETDLSMLVLRSAAEERAYFLKRAEDHRRLAAEGPDPGSRSLHMRFRELYLDRACVDRDSTLQPDKPAKIPGTSTPIDG